jgi:hypothetical protein
MKTFLTALWLLIVNILFAQQKHNYSSIEPSEWVIPNTNGQSYLFDIYKGAKALILKKNFDNYKFAGIAYPKGLDFKDGQIELDMASTTGKDFVGLAFRVVDAHHYQTLYFRPASSGTINAVQYMPEKKEDFNWWDYEANKYQAEARLPATGWFHIKAVVKGRQLTVYVDHQPKPVMVFDALDPSLTHGSVGFWIGNSDACAYKNLVVKIY